MEEFNLTEYMERLDIKNKHFVLGVSLTFCIGFVFGKFANYVI